MRPNDLYSWYCVAQSITGILGHAVNIRTTQAAAWSQATIARKRRRLNDSMAPNEGTAADDWPERVNRREHPNRSADGRLPSTQAPSIALGQDLQSHLDRPKRGQRTDVQSPTFQILDDTTTRTSSDPIVVPTTPHSAPPAEEQMQLNNSSRPQDGSLLKNPPLTSNALGDLAAQSTNTTDETSEHSGDGTAYLAVNSSPSLALKASKVPSSRIGRLFHYGGLAASLGYGAASEIVRRSSQSDPNRPGSNSLLMTEANLNKLVSKLSQMRGAALKMGQFMSIQDSHVLPEELEQVFRRVQDSAHYMPNWQMENVMSSSLGPSWRSHFSSFTPVPSHSASIGQVHIGLLAPSSSPTGKEEEVAIKIQFPNIAQSISSDLGYMKLILGASALLPKGLFLDSTIKVFKEELADECNYRREADCMRKFHEMDAIKSDLRYRVPWVWEGSTETVLVMERMRGVSVGGDIVKTLTQKDRDEIAARVIELCLRELFEFRMMQTDPNWSNFLWNQHSRQIELIDFGATREYSKEFIDSWLGLLTAAIRSDRDACIEWSTKLGYFVGGENEAMINAHLTSMQLLGTPFRASTPQPYLFARGSEWTTITEEIRAQIPIMLNNRLTPPPRETYSLNRKLSGAFLLAGRLGASVDCRSLWDKVIEGNSIFR